MDKMRQIEIKTFKITCIYIKIINKETPQYLHDLVALKKIILGTAIQHIYQQSRLPGMD
jgi:hypothetical protein